MTSLTERQYSNDEKRIESLEAWMTDIINPLIQKHPRLQETDLVVEGGVGQGIIMSQIVRKAFPGVIYVGTDILKFNQSLSDSVEYEAELQRILAIEEGKVPVSSADCYRSEFIKYIIERLGAKSPLLVTQNALSAILDEHPNLYLPSPSPDVIAGNNSIYKAQLHLDRTSTAPLLSSRLRDPILDSHGYIEDIAMHSEIQWIIDRENPHATLLLKH